jgi:hypothetical protein
LRKSRARKSGHASRRGDGFKNSTAIHARKIVSKHCAGANLIRKRVQAGRFRLNIRIKQRRGLVGSRVTKTQPDITLDQIPEPRLFRRIRLCAQTFALQRPQGLGGEQFSPRQSLVPFVGPVAQLSRALSPALPDKPVSERRSPARWRCRRH